MQRIRVVSPTKAALVRDSFRIIRERCPDVVRRGLAILFARHPEHRTAMRGLPVAERERMLLDALVAILARLDDASVLVEILASFGARHVRSGITQETYARGAAAMLTAFEEAAGDTWTSDVEAAWRETSSAIAAMMLAGARTVRPVDLRRCEAA